MLSTNNRLLSTSFSQNALSTTSISTTLNCSCSSVSNFGFQFACNCNSSEISTIFIIGFPDDFKERELTNMFLFAPGFEGSVLKTTTISSICGVTAGTVFDDPMQRKQQLIGFVKFSKASEAAYALDILNGRILDQERGVILKAEIAKKNLFIKPTSTSTSTTTTMISRKSIDEEIISTSQPLNNYITCPSCESPNGCNNLCPQIISSKSPQLHSPNRFMSITLPGQSNPALITAPSEDHIMSEDVNLNANTIARPLPIAKVLNSVTSTSASVSPTASVSPILLLKAPMPTPERIIDLCVMQRNLINSPTLGRMAAIVGENFPCNTLYVGNLPPSAQEEELRALFRNCLGYRRLSFRPKASGPMCFVEFDDIACATAAMETLYGTMISCSIPAKGGIRLSFSKNPLGLRVASPAPITTVNSTTTTTTNVINNSPISSNSSSNSSFFEAIGAETSNPNHQQAIATIFSHYYQNNPHKNPEFISSFIKNLPGKNQLSSA